MSKLQEISPVTKTTTVKNAKFEMLSFLSKVLRLDNFIGESDISDVQSQTDVGRLFRIVTLEQDASKWVIGDKGAERVIGSYYLDKQLKKMKNLEVHWSSVQTKYLVKSEILTFTFKYHVDFGTYAINSDSVISLSKYAGKTKLQSASLFDLDSLSKVMVVENDKEKISSEIGYKDFVSNTNLRKQEDGSITIIDTEYASFSKGTTSESSEKVPGIEGLKYSFSLDTIFSFAIFADSLNYNRTAIGLVQEYLSDESEWETLTV